MRAEKPPNTSITAAVFCDGLPGARAGASTASGGSMFDDTDIAAYLCRKGG